MSDFIPNSTQLPNLYLDRLMAMLSGDEWKVVCYMARRLFGFQKRQDRISLKQICSGIRSAKTGEMLDHGTNLNHTTVIRALNELVRYGVAIETAPADKAKNLATEWSLQLESQKVDWLGLEGRQQERRASYQRRTGKGRKQANAKVQETPPTLSDRVGQEIDPTLSDRVGPGLSDRVGPTLSHRAPLLYPIEQQYTGEIKGKGEEEKSSDNDGRLFVAKTGLADKNRKYSALQVEPTLRDHAIVACQGMGVTHFSGIFKKRQAAVGRALNEIDWQEIVDWCAHYQEQVATGKIRQANVAPLLVAAIRDGEPAPLKPEPESGDWKNLEFEIEEVEAEEEAEDPDDLWSRVKKEIRSKVTRGAYMEFVYPTDLLRQDGRRLIVAVPNQHVVDFYNETGGNMLRRTVNMIGQRSYEIEFLVQGQHGGQHGQA